MLDIYVYGMVNEMLNMSWEECHVKYEKLCHKLCNHYKNVNLDYDERFNLALFGLWKAWKYYDGESSSFMTYANFIIRQEFNLIYRNNKAKKRKHEIHLDLNHTDDEGNRFEEVLEDAYINGYCHMSRINELLNDFSEVCTQNGKYFIEKVNGRTIHNMMDEYNISKRTMYKYIEKGKIEFADYLTEKDVFL